MTRFAVALALFSFCAPPGDQNPQGGAGPSVPAPRAMDLCPVCGMIVSKYPDWTATIVWKDGRVQHFDGAKDMFKFLQALAKYAPGRRRSDIRLMAVTDYYSLAKVEAEKAFYVIGSDVMGPMGHDLAPLAARADAEDFLKDHRGKRILRFEEVTPAIVAMLDAGRF